MSHTMLKSGFVAALILSLAMSAQSATVRVYGTVTDSEGTLIPGAEVIFRAYDDTVTAITDADGRYEAFLTEQPAGILDGQSPVPFVLSQNYPNPFNPATTIPFSLDRTARVRLDIYSVSGQHIRTLVDEVCNAGNHSVVWDGRDDTGRGVSSGVYIYRLRAGSKVAAKKMLLLDGGGPGSAIVQPPAKAAAAAAEREYFVEAKKRSLYTGFYTSVSFLTSATEFNIIFHERYKKHALLLDSIRLLNEFVIPADTLSVVLATVHDVLPEGDQIVTLVSQVGDIETIVVGSMDGSYYWHDNCDLFGTNNWRNNFITTIAAPPELDDGILQVDAVSDTIFAYYALAAGDSLSEYIPVVASYETVTIGDNKYLSWVQDVWYTVDDNERTGNIIYPDELRVRFTEVATGSDIESFIAENSFEIIRAPSEYIASYLLRITTGIHTIEYLAQYEDLDIIEYLLPNYSFCVD